MTISTMRKLYAFVIVLLGASPLLAQTNIRWDLPVYTVQGQGGNLLPVYAVPGAGVSFYSCSGSTCTTLATTYISGSSSTACPSTAQVVLNGGSSCVSSADPYGNMGGWFQPGEYIAAITAQGTLYDYYFTVGDGAGGTGPFLPLSGGTMAGPIGFSGGSAATTLNNLCPAGGCTFANPVNVPKLNNVYKVDQFSGATAGAQLTACASALATAGGGICDARGYGPTVQTISSTVTIGNGAVETFIFDPSTVFEPSSTSVTLLSLDKGTRLKGFTAQLPSGYSVPAMTIADNIRDTDDFSIEETHISGAFTTPAAGSSCLSMTASNVSTDSIAFARISNFHCNNVYYGIDPETTGTGFINGNIFTNLVFDGTVIAIHSNGASSSATVSGNIFTNVVTQEQSWSSYPVQLSGYSNLNVFTGFAAWDTGATYDVYLGSNANNNFFQGYFGKGFYDGTNGTNSWVNLYPSSAQNGSVGASLYLMRAVNPGSNGTNVAVNGYCPNMTTTQICNLTLNNGSDWLNLDFYLAGAASGNNYAGLGIDGVDNLKIYGDGHGSFAGPLDFGGGGQLSSSSNLPQFCGNAGFASGTAASVSCSWVTTSSHCLLSWDGSAAGGVLGYTPNNGSVSVTAAVANSGAASVYCSKN